MDENSESVPDDIPESAKASKRFSIKRFMIVIVGTSTLFIIFFAPAVIGGRTSTRLSCASNLRQLAFAMQAYNADYGTFPPAYTVDGNGRRLHSWRTLLLPYLDAAVIYRKIDFTKPWDDPVNKEYSTIALPIFRCPSKTRRTSETCYMVIVSDRSCFPPGQSTSIEDITDGPESTLLIVESPADRSVPWMSPNDLDEAQFLSINPHSKLQHPGGFVAIMADGTDKFISVNTSRADLQQFMTKAANDKVSDEKILEK